MAASDTDEPSSSDVEDVSREEGHQGGSATPEVMEDVSSEVRVSYYVQVWDEMLDTVLARESYLFTDRELATIERFRQMSYPARYLFIRLFVRRRGYFRVNSLTRYARDVPDVKAACAELCSFDSFDSELHKKQRQREATPPPTRTVIVLDGSPVQQQPTASTSAVTLENTHATPETDPESLYDRALGRFAQDEAALVQRSDLDELAAMVTMDELKSLTRHMNLAPPKIQKNGKTIPVNWTRASLIQALKKQSTGQSTLFNFAASSSSTTTKAADKQQQQQQRRSLSLAFSVAGKKRSQADFVVQKLFDIIGPLIKVDDASVKLFLRLHLVFHRCPVAPNHNTLTNALLSRFEKRSYPDYRITRQFTIFPDRATFLDFEQAVAMEQRVEAALEVARSPLGGYRPSATTDGGTRKKPRAQLDAEVEAWQKGRRSEKRKRFMHVKECFELSWAMWTSALEKETQTMLQVKDPNDPDDRRSYYMRRFRPGWVLTHCVFKSMDALAYFHLWEREAAVLRALLGQTYFCRGRRGKWWDRLALILMEHGVGGRSTAAKDGAIGGQSSDEDDLVVVNDSKDSLERCRREALALCWEGLEDQWCHLVERHSLQRRIVRLESMLKVPQEKRHVFPAGLNTATEVLVEGTQLGDRIAGKKAYWKSTEEVSPEDEDLGTLAAEGISVEDLSLQHYRTEGWQGVHSENTILTMIFGMLFYDILFVHVDGAFETPYQAEPLDLRSDAFSIVRHDLIWQRLAQIRDGQTPELLRSVDDSQRHKGTWCVGVRWDAFSADEIQEAAACIGDEALAIICQVYAEDYEHRSGGVPDLFLWKPQRRRCKFSEVKGPGDRISKTQKVWIDVLLSCGLAVDKCSVKDKRTIKKKRPAVKAEQASSDLETELKPVVKKSKKKRGSCCKSFSV